MTALIQLHQSGIRNLLDVTLEPNLGINLITGANGAGKSSLLEAIHILSTGRSFRTRHIKDVITHEQDQLVVSGKVSHQSKEFQLGIEKSTQKARVRLNREPVKRISELSKVLPLVVLHPSSYTLLTGEPAKRRAYLDWGAFHFRPEFLSHWRQYSRILDQRNAALRSNARAEEVSLWNKSLATAGQFLHDTRKEYLEQLSLIIPEIYPQLGFDYVISADYRAGWNQDISLFEALEQGLERDRQLKYTYAGPHRADLRVKLDNYKADAVASRGQLKLTTLLLLLAQAAFYQQNTNSACILLLDDLPSEFDQEHLEKIINVVQSSQNQCFITTIDASSIPFAEQQVHTMFHVEQGKIQNQA